jgi:hypothetical protein
MARRANDFYATPDWAAHTLVSLLSMRGRVLECCVGDGALLPALRSNPDVLAVFTNDVDRSRECDSYEDVSHVSSWNRLPQVDWVVTNPPFNLAPSIIPLAYSHARQGIAMLLRLSYLEPCENRGAWLAKFPPSKLIVLERISFTGDGKTDNVTCAWMVWSKTPLFGAPFVIVPKRQPELRPNLESDLAMATHSSAS